MKNYLILLLLLPSIVFAQGKNKKKIRPEFTVIGSVLDSVSDKALAFATVSFLDFESQALVTGGICNESGVFSIEKVNSGTYKLLVEYIGYEPRILNNLKVSPSRGSEVDRMYGATTVGDKSINLGDFKLLKSVEQLQEVELIEEKSFVVQGIDRKIYNVGQDITNSGGSAIELMEKLPSVQVDIDGNLSLRGSNQVRLFVDGKPSMLSSSDLLETLPSSMIESIELITNPSAKFSPEGMAGIINIVLKKNEKAGFNGTITGTLGSPTRTNFTTLLNRRSEKLNVFGSYGYMDRTTRFKSESENHTYFDADTFDLFQEKSGEQLRNSHTFKGGLDFTPNESTTFSLQGNYSPSQRSKLDTINYLEINSLDSLRYDRFSDSKTVQDNWNIDFNGKKNWDSGLLLNFSIDQSQNIINKSSLFTQTPINNINTGEENYFSIEQLSSDKVNRQFEAKLDFSYGNEEDGKFEWGFSSRTRTMDQDLSSEDSTSIEMVDNSNLENQFFYKDDVHAAFGTYAKSFGLIALQAGLRVEDVYTVSELKNDSSEYNYDYFELYPSCYLTYNLDETETIQASYSRRVNRPSFRTLNPFPEYSDPFNLRMGNPYLKPEFINSFEIAYQKFSKGTTISASVYAKDLNNMQRRFIAVDSNSVSTVTYRNLNGSLDLGVELMWSKQVSKAFNFMLSTNIYHSQMDASNLTTEFDESTFSMWSNFNIAYKRKGQKLQFSGWISPGTSVGQGTMETMLSTDLAYSRPVLSDKGRLTLKISDLFNTRRFGIDTSGANFEKSFFYKRQTQTINLSLSYNFGDQSNNKQRRSGSRDGGGDMDGGFF